MIANRLRCEMCGHNMAGLVWSRRQQDQLQTLSLCSSCAAYCTKISNGKSFNIIGFMNGLERKEFSTNKDSTCHLCGTSISEIISDSKPGCCLCYDTFRSEMSLIIEEMQNEVKHYGKTPTK